MSFSKTAKGSKPRLLTSSQPRVTRGKTDVDDSAEAGGQTSLEKNTQPFSIRERGENEGGVRYRYTPEDTHEVDNVDGDDEVEDDTDLDGGGHGVYPMVEGNDGESPRDQPRKRVVEKTRPFRLPPPVSNRSRDSKSQVMASNRSGRLGRRTHSSERNSKHRRSVSDSPDSRVQNLHGSEFTKKFNRNQAWVWLYSLRVHCLYYELRSEEAKFTLLICKLPTEITAELLEYLPKIGDPMAYTKTVKLIMDHYGNRARDKPRKITSVSEVAAALLELTNQDEDEYNENISAAREQSQQQKSKSRSRIFNTLVRYDWDNSPYEKSKCCQQHQIYANLAFFCRWKNTCPMRAIVRKKQTTRDGPMRAIVQEKKTTRDDEGGSGDADHGCQAGKTYYRPFQDLQNHTDHYVSPTLNHIEPATLLHSTEIPMRNARKAVHSRRNTNQEITSNQRGRSNNAESSTTRAATGKPVKKRDVGTKNANGTQWYDHNDDEFHHFRTRYGRNIKPRAEVPFLSYNVGGIYRQHYCSTDAWQPCGRY